MRDALKLVRVLLAAFLTLGPVFAQAPAAAPTATAKPTALTDADLKIDVPKAELRAKGDRDGSLTGNTSDIAVTDAKKGLTLGDVLNQVGQNKIAINFVWTLITGFLVMFMQLGFALLETGLCRARNANHTMMMNVVVYGVGMLAYWMIGFSLQMGGVGAIANLGGTAPLSGEFAIKLFGKDFGLWGQNGLFLMHKGTYDVSVMVLFLFQMVFMDTGATIPTGAAAERWKFAAFVVSSFLFAAFTYPLFANWAWGGGWMANLGINFGLGKGYVDFAGSGVVHAVRRAIGPGHRDTAGPAHRQVQPRRKTARHPGPRPRSCPHRLPDSGIRMVRLQPGLHARRIEQRQFTYRLSCG